MGTRQGTPSGRPSAGGRNAQINGRQVARRSAAEDTFTEGGVRHRHCFSCGGRGHGSAASSSALLGGARLRLQPDKLLGHVVAGALGEDAHGGEARVVHVDALTQRAPAGAAALPRDVLQLHHRQPHHPVGASEAVVFDAELQLVAAEVLLVSQDAGREKRHQSFEPPPTPPAPERRPPLARRNLQVEGLVELGRPAVVLGFGLELSLPVAEVGPDGADLHEGPEHSGRLPLQIAGADH